MAQQEPALPARQLPPAGGRPKTHSKAQTDFITKPQAPDLRPAKPAPPIPKKPQFGAGVKSLAKGSPPKMIPRHQSQAAVRPALPPKNVANSPSSASPAQIHVNNITTKESATGETSSKPNKSFRNTVVVNMKVEAPIQTTQNGELILDTSKSLEIALEDPLFKKVEVTITTKRDNIANELLTTEQSYVRSLTILNEMYRKPLLEAARLGDISSLTEEVVNQIFSRNLLDILRVNTTLLQGLVERLISWNDTQLLGDLLLDLTPFLKMYTQYTGNYERAVEILDELEQKEGFVNLLQKLGDNPIRAGLNPRAFLIMPIQRIPRYRLLLEDFVKNTPAEHPDHNNLINALERLKNVAEQVDQAIFEQKNRQQMFKIQKRLIDTVQIIEPGRFFIKEGELTKICRKDHKKRYFFLFNDIVLYAKELPSSRYINHTLLKLASVGIKDLPDDTKRGLSNAIQIASEKKSFVVYTSTPEEKASWIKELNKALETLENNLRTLKNSAKQRRVSTLAPVWVPDSETKTCTICGVRFTLTNRRHHCRQCGQVVCNRCSSKRKDLPGQGKQRVCDICFTKPYVTAQASTSPPPTDPSPTALESSEEEEGVQENSGVASTSTIPINAKNRHLSMNVAGTAQAASASPPKRQIPSAELWVAQYDYAAPEESTPRKLSFKVGDILSIIQKDPTGWWLAELNGSKGWVPAGYLQKK